MFSFISKSLRAPFSVCSKLISVSQFIVLSISSPEISKIKNSIFLPFSTVQEIIFEDMKDILEKEIQIRKQRFADKETSEQFFHSKELFLVSQETSEHQSYPTTYIPSNL